MNVSSHSDKLATSDQLASSGDNFARNVNNMSVNNIRPSESCNDTSPRKSYSSLGMHAAAAENAVECHPLLNTQKCT